MGMARAAIDENRGPHHRSTPSSSIMRRTASRGSGVPTMWERRLTCSSMRASNSADTRMDRVFLALTFPMPKRWHGPPSESTGIFLLARCPGLMHYLFMPTPTKPDSVRRMRLAVDSMAATLIATRDTIPAPRLPLECRVCLGAGFGPAPCRVHGGSCDCAGYDSHDEPCPHCEGSGIEPCRVCDAAKRPAVEVIDGEALCETCSALTKDDVERDLRARQDAALERHLAARRRIDRQIWLGLDSEVRWNLLARGVVRPDPTDGTPVIASRIAVAIVHDIIKALGTRPAARRTA